LEDSRVVANSAIANTSLYDLTGKIIQGASAFHNSYYQVCSELMICPVL